MLLKETTYRQQSLLAEYTRSSNDVIISELHGIKEKGIRYYRELIFNIIWDTISNAYPIMTDFFGEDEMKQLAHRFFTNHKCQHPQVWAMPKEFMDYVNANEPDLINQYPFLSELMLFEWKEIELFMMPDKPIPAYQNKGSVITDILVLLPEIEIIHFAYPVFLLHPSEITDETKGKYIILMYRDIDTKEVLFNALSEISERAVNILKEQPLSLRELEKKLALTIQQKNHIKEFIQTALKDKIILGFLKE